MLDQEQVISGGSVVVVLGAQDSHGEQRREGSEGEDESSVGGLVDVGSRDAADRGLADSDGQADYRGGRLPVCGAERGTTSPDSYAVITA